MRKISILYFTSLVLFSCQNSTTKENNIDEKLKDKLPASLVENPRSANSPENISLNELGHLQFIDTLHDFGTMKEGEKAEYDFVFTNSGKRDIIISNAKGSCGCTVPEYSSDPIKSGKEGKIKVTFNSQGKHGFNEKSVLITTNGNPSEYELIINATVN